MKLADLSLPITQRLALSACLASCPILPLAAEVPADRLALLHPLVFRPPPNRCRYDSVAAAADFPRFLQNLDLTLLCHVLRTGRSAAGSARSVVRPCD